MENLSGYKKIILIITFILAVILTGYFIYFLFFKPVLTGTKTTPGATTTLSGQLPTAGQGQPATTTGEIVTTEEGLPVSGTIADTKANGGLTQVTALNSVSTLNPSLSNNGKDVQYYNTNDGKFYRINKDGGTTAISDKVFHNVETVTWSPTEDKAILEYPDGSNIVYDFNTQKQITLPQHWKDFNFSTNGDKIVMKSMGIDRDNRWLAITNTDGSKVQAIEPLGDNEADVYTDWSPNNQMIAMYVEGVDFNRQEIYFVGLNDENFKSTVIEGRGFQPKWSPTGNQLVYSVYSSDNNMKPQLWAVDAQGDNIGNNRHRLNVETWAEKCVFSEQTKLYCAVPESLQEGAGLFPELAKNTKDNLYQIDIKTGLKKLIAVPDSSYNMSNLIVTEDGSNLFFTDSNTQQLYKIKLK